MKYQIGKLIKQIMNFDPDDLTNYAILITIYDDIIKSLNEYKDKNILLIIDDLPRIVDILIGTDDEKIRNICVNILAEIALHLIEYGEGNNNKSSVYIRSIYSKIIDVIILYKNEEFCKDISKNFFKIALQTLKKKDPSTLHHSIQVSRYVIDIAKRMKCNVDLDVLQQAAMLHDIGKILTDDSISYLNNTHINSQTSQQNNHCLLGYNMVKDLAINRNIKDAILYHHEAYDGTGYPAGLKGDKIPLVARIINIAEAYDVLTEVGYGEKTYTKQDAIAIMCNNRHKYDPDLLEIFLTLFNYRKLNF